LQLLQGLLGGLHGQIGQQQPFDGRLAGRRLGLAGQDGGDLHLGQGAVGATWGRQCHAHRADLLLDRAGLAAVAGGPLEGSFGKHWGFGQVQAQGLAIGQYPVVLTTDQPVRGRFGARGLDEEVVDIGLAVGHVGQAGVGEGLGQLVDPLVTVHPAHAFLLLQGAVGILVLAETAGRACPGIPSEQPQTQPLRGQRQRRVQVQPLA
jgi:hypothetical protein